MHYKIIIICRKKKTKLFQINEKLDHITTYLRSAYFYCIWCCIKYNDKKELMQECPGTSREDH